MAEQLPEEFEKYMKVRLGLSWADFQQSLKHQPPVSVRYNSRKLKPPNGETIPWCLAGRYLVDRPSFTLDPLFHGGAYYVQEASSMLLEQALIQSVNVQDALRVLDLCAAPGGKSTHLLSLLSDESLLFTNEVIRSRATVLLENIEKWGYNNVIVTNNDPADFERVPGQFDLVLVDAPCSGEGLFRKEPDSIHQWSSKHVELCSLRQRRILKDVWPCLKPGGILIYTTCTYNHAENMDNLAWLGTQEEIEFLPLHLNPGWGLETLENGKSIGYQCYPHRLRGEGFFLSVIRKIGDHSPRKVKLKDKLIFPSAQEKEQLRPWVESFDSQLFFLHGRQVRMLPESMNHELLIALQSLHVVGAGTAVGEVIKNKVIPEHALALSLKLPAETISKIMLNEAEALSYLRKNPIQAPGGKGIHLVEYQGIGLGWANVLPNRVNNLYPAERRIRMA